MLALATHEVGGLYIIEYCIYILYVILYDKGDIWQVIKAYCIACSVYMYILTIYFSHNFPFISSLIALLFSAYFPLILAQVFYPSRVGDVWSP